MEIEMAGARGMTKERRAVSEMFPAYTKTKIK